VLHHLKHNLDRPETHVIITGFQAPGTLGRQLVDRAPIVRIHGESIRVAAKLHTLGGLSAHGDQDDLLRWVRNFRAKPPVYLVHGEVSSASAFGDRLHQEQFQATVTSPGLKLDLAALPALADDFPT
jgi:metallo-beta-lactamase family protein